MRRKQMDGQTDRQIDKIDGQIDRGAIERERQIDRGAIERGTRYLNALEKALMIERERNNDVCETSLVRE